MKTSLTILIILTVVVLVVILMTSPTCKNAVGAVLGKKKALQTTPPVQKPTVKSIPRPSSAEMKTASNAMKPKSVPVEHRPVGPQVHTLAQSNVPISQPRQEVMSDPKFEVLSGNILDMFNSTMDVSAEFGLTDEQVDAMAREYKASHLDVKKEEVTRHRSIIRSQLDEADAKLRDGFQRPTGRKQTAEDSIIAMREERLSRGEDMMDHRKPSAKLNLMPKNK